MLSLFISILLVQQAFSHMEMVSPFPLRSPRDPTVLEAYKDYDMTSPLEADGSNFPCKRYQYTNTNPQADNIKAVYQAGNTYNFVLQGSANHNGGSCQVSLSYDNGQSFKVIKSIIGGCPLTPSYNFTIPTFAPSSNTVLLSWSWFNIVGNREMYQNCARVQVNGSGSQKSRRDQKRAVRRQTSMDALPDMFACNVNNGCRTIERREVVFPNPGSDVVFGTNAIAVEPGPGFVITAATTSSSPAQPPSSTASIATVATPSSNVTTTAASLASTVSATTAPFPFLNSSSTIATGSLSSAFSSFSISPSNTTSPTTGVVSSTVSSLATVSTSTGSVILTSTTTSSLTATSSPVASSTATSTVSTTTQTAPSTFVTTISPTVTSSTELPGPSPPASMSTSTFSTSMIQITTTTTTTPQVPPTTLATLTSSSSAIPTASPNPLPLPCTPGAFACNSPTTFSRCVTNAAGSTSYVFFGSVAPGTVCQNGQFVRANEGPCTPDGELFCNGERSFFLCGHGGLINMGPTAPGTVCRNGVVVAG